MRKTALQSVAPATVIQTVTEPRRKPNTAYRTREYLTAEEVDRLLVAAKANRAGHRDYCAVLIAYRHGLRAAEICDLRWDQVNWRAATLHVNRVKQGTPALHPITGDELRALRKLHREQKPRSPWMFVSERGSPFKPAGFARMVSRAGVAAGLPFTHAHMLRHACGFKLANDGHDTRSLQAYLGHKNIQHTVRYTAMTDRPFRDFWR